MFQSHGCSFLACFSISAFISLSSLFILYAFKNLNLKNNI